MTDDATRTPVPPTELPPVDPPSARFIMQLFVIPFIVVVILVCLLLVVYGLFGRLATGGQDTTHYVQAIRSENENRRWRAAYELASLIYNEPKLASDPTLCGQLAELLRDELSRPASGKTTDVARYLALALGSFKMTPELIDKAAVDPLAMLVKALADPAPPEVRTAAAQSLSRLAADTEAALPSDRVIPALAAAATADSDPAVRQNAAYALGYFDTPAARAALDQATGDADRFVRFNAAAALGRLGDLNGVPVLREILSTPDITAAIAAQSPERAAEVAGRVEAIQIEALLSLQAAPEASRGPMVDALAPLLEELTTAAAPRSVQVEARSLLKK